MRFNPQPINWRKQLVPTITPKIPKMTLEENDTALLDTLEETLLGFSRVDVPMMSYLQSEAIPVGQILTLLSAKIFSVGELHLKNITVHYFEREIHIKMALQTPWESTQNSKFSSNIKIVADDQFIIVRVS